MSSTGPLLGMARRRVVPRSTRVRALHRDREGAKRVVQTRLAVRGLTPVADDVRAGDVRQAAGETALTRARNHHRARRDGALQHVAVGALAHVDDVCRLRDHGAGTEDGLASHADTLDHDAAAADEGAVLDDHGLCVRRLEHTTDADTT